MKEREKKTKKEKKTRRTLYTMSRIHFKNVKQQREKCQTQIYVHIF